MELDLVSNKLNLTELTSGPEKKTPTGVYCSDMLSCVMSGAGQGHIWVTLQSHMNVVGVASLLDLTCIIITEGSMPDAETIQKANSEGITLYLTDAKSFEVCGRLWELGLRP